jgi:hypothetical protein
MTQIPSGTKFVGIASTVPTPENRSSQNNAFQEVYTVDDIRDSVLADLDIVADSIVSEDNGDINIVPDGTGSVVIGGNSTQPTELRFMEDADNGTNYVSLKAASSLAASTSFTLPTADGTSDQVLKTNGSGVLSWTTISSGITVGTTPVTSGTVGRILFEGAGGVVQQDADLFWDNTNKRLGIGATPDASTRLDVRAQGALSTDIAFRVRNSANTVNSVEYQGGGYKIWRAHSGDMHFAFDPANNRLHLKRTGNYDIFTDNAVTQLSMICNAGSLQLRGGIKMLHIYNGGNFHLGGTELLAGSGDGNLIFQNGTAPSTNLTDRHYYYSDDITAGNAAPHFRTENGAIIKLYQETTGVAAAAFVSNTSLILDDSATYGGYTMGQVVAALKAQGLLA